MALSLEEILEKSMQEAAGREIGPQPYWLYDTDYFADNQDEIDDLREYSGKLATTDASEDAQRDKYIALMDLWKRAQPYLPLDKTQRAVIWSEWCKNPAIAMRWLQRYLDKAEIRMAGYVQKNRGVMLSRMNDKQLLELVQKVRLPFTGNKKYDNFEELKGKYIAMQNNPNQVGAIVGEDVNKYISQLTDDQRSYIAEMGGEMENAIVRGVVSGIERTFKSYFMTRDGFNRSAAIDYIENGITFFEDFMKEHSGELSQSKIDDYVRDNLRKPVFLPMADILMKTEKPMWKSHRYNKLLEERVKAEARQYRMAA